MRKIANLNWVSYWQFAYVFLASTWLLAPGLNRVLSDRTTLISEYESMGQPYSLLFRSFDFLAALLLLYMAVHIYRSRRKSYESLLLIVVAVGTALDPILQLTCSTSGTVCHNSHSIIFVAHGIESIITALGLFLLALWDTKRRNQVISIAFLIFQAGYGIVAVSRIASHMESITAPQFLYQYVSIVWLAWFVRDYFFHENIFKHSQKRVVLIRYTAALWVLLNGLLAIVLSLTHLNLFGKVQNLYFSNDTAWLAQHGVIVGIILIYLSRHLFRGERLARQIVLGVFGIEVLKYAVIAPSWELALLYSLSFSLLLSVVHDFRRGTVPITWKVRAKDIAYSFGVIIVAGMLMFVIVNRNTRVARIAEKSTSHFSSYAFHSGAIPHTPVSSILLAHVFTALVAASSALILWILFRPNKIFITAEPDREKLKDELKKYSTSSEDYFKLWPHDKSYYFSKTGEGFVAYKVVGSVAFALPDPVASSTGQRELRHEFTDWLKTRRHTACFLPIPAQSLQLYDDMTTVQIGASAVVDSEVFTTATIKEKWWRWKMNRATKQGYEFCLSELPHSREILSACKQVSDAWLAAGNHQERGFAMGYYDDAYLQQCRIYYLRNPAGEIVAIANQLPNLKKLEMTTIDLMRYLPDDRDSMPFLLANIIAVSHQDGFKYFDLGFVPFAGTKGPLLSFAQAISSRRFSAQGLKQFKSKFNPVWQDTYMAYDGDFADLAAVALNIEAAMEHSQAD
ncbi:MAG: phosphatidylglycerol lysyltransferase domain-containing protein [Patescibacteria group bacterium]|nr:phosphatidylglycerol lysyltransferase domain-containing protein [Patescibacteria group bacterium]